METTKPASPHGWIRFVLTILGIAGVLFFVSRNLSAIQDFIGHSGWIGIIISIGLYGLLGLSPIPSEPLTILLSTVYGPLSATLVSGIGNLLAAVMEYSIGERLGSAANFEQRRKSLPFGLGKLEVNSVPFLLAARMLPGYGPKFVSVISGMYRVPTLRYLWTAAVPTFLGSAIFAYGGHTLIQQYFPYHLQ